MGEYDWIQKCKDGSPSYRQPPSVYLGDKNEVATGKPLRDLKAGDSWSTIDEAEYAERKRKSQARRKPPEKPVSTEVVPRPREKSRIAQVGKDTERRRAYEPTLDNAQSSGPHRDEYQRHSRQPPPEIRSQYHDNQQLPQQIEFYASHHVSELHRQQSRPRSGRRHSVSEHSQQLPLRPPVPPPGYVTYAQGPAQSQGECWSAEYPIATTESYWEWVEPIRPPRLSNNGQPGHRVPVKSREAPQTYSEPMIPIGIRELRHRRSQSVGGAHPRLQSVPHHGHTNAHHNAQPTPGQRPSPYQAQAAGLNPHVDFQAQYHQDYLQQPRIPPMTPGTPACYCADPYCPYLACRRLPPAGYLH